MSNSIVTLSDNLDGIESLENQLRLFSIKATKHHRAVKPDIWVKRCQKANLIVLEPFINSRQKIKCLCLICGYKCNKKAETINKMNCAKCSNLERYTDETIKSKLQKFQCELLEDFKSSIRFKHKILYKCGHISNSRLSDILYANQGCPSCAFHGFNSSKSGILYYVHFENQNLWKIGITNRTILDRFQGEINYDQIPVHVWKGRGSKCLELEKIVKNSYKALLYNGKWSKENVKATEIFTEDISKLESFKFIKSLASRFELKLL